MTPETKAILEILTKYLEENPTIRFTQALFNLGINDFPTDNSNPPLMKDNFHDTNMDVLKRMKNATA
jgi:hypothetical protein